MNCIETLDYPIIHECQAAVQEFTLTHCYVHMLLRTAFVFTCTITKEIYINKNGSFGVTTWCIFTSQDSARFMYYFP